MRWKGIHREKQLISVTGRERETENRRERELNGGSEMNRMGHNTKTESASICRSNDMLTTTTKNNATKNREKIALLGKKPSK